MGTRLEGVVTARGGFRRGHSARRLAIDAARRALERSGHRPPDVELLVNCGLFRDRNIGEPALAPMIQQDLGANPEDPHPGGHGTFSFDVANSACGVLSALEIADRFLQAGTLQLALVVTSDADPGHGLAPGFPFEAAGGALVCTWHESTPGLGVVHWRHAEVDGDDFFATVGDQEGRNVLVVREGAAFAEKAALTAAEAALAALDDAGVKPSDVDVVVGGLDRPVYRRRFADATGIDDQRVLTAGRRQHTVAPLTALERADSAGHLASGRTVLLVCAGAGVTAGAVLYRP